MNAVASIADESHVMLNQYTEIAGKLGTKMLESIYGKNTFFDNEGGDSFKTSYGRMD